MIRFQTTQGVNFPGATGLPTITRTPEGRAMGAVPGWAMLLDPSYGTEQAGLRNRAKRAAMAGHSALGPSAISLALASANMGGQDAVYIPDDGGARLQPNVAFNPDAWTFFAVMKPRARPSSFLGMAWSVDGATGRAPKIGLTADATRFQVWENTDPANSATRISYNAGSPLTGIPRLFMATFSTREGMRLYLDGTEVARAPGANLPFSRGAGAGQWEVFYAGRGWFGMTGLLDIDLGWAEHAGHRRAIAGFLRQKYGLS